MRALLAGCVLLVAGTVGAVAQPDYGYGGGPPPPPPPGYGYGGYYHRPPPPPPPYGYGYRRHCYIVEGYYGPHRVCR